MKTMTLRRDQIHGWTRTDLTLAGDWLPLCFVQGSSWRSESALISLPDLTPVIEKGVYHHESINFLILDGNWATIWDKAHALLTFVTTVTTGGDLLFFKLVSFFCKENSKFWPILTPFHQFWIFCREFKHFQRP